MFCILMTYEVAWMLGVRVLSMVMRKVNSPHVLDGIEGLLQIDLISRQRNHSKCIDIFSEDRKSTTRASFTNFESSTLDPPHLNKLA